MRIAAVSNCPFLTCSFFTELKNLISQPQSTAPGNKRALPAAALAVLKNPKVQEAAVDKGIEVVGKMVDKTLEKVEHAQNKAAEFLKKEVWHSDILIFYRLVNPLPYTRR